MLLTRRLRTHCVLARVTKLSVTSPSGRPSKPDEP